MLVMLADPAGLSMLQKIAQGLSAQLAHHLSANMTIIVQMFSWPRWLAESL